MSIAGMPRKLQAARQLFVDFILAGARGLQVGGELMTAIHQILPSDGHNLVDKTLTGEELDPISVSCDRAIKRSLAIRYQRPIRVVLGSHERAGSPIDGKRDQ
jgi:predicted nuclease with TOPRIM domain